MEINEKKRKCANILQIRNLREMQKVILQIYPEIKEEIYLLIPQTWSL